MNYFAATHGIIAQKCMNQTLSHGQGTFSLENYY